MDSELDYAHQIRNGEHFFRAQTPKELTPGWDLDSQWDAYELRAAFEKLQTPEDAWRFLNVTGMFRYKRRQSKQADVAAWRELQGWQEVLKRLRLRGSSEWFPTLAPRNSDTKELFERMLADGGLEGYSEQIWSVSDETYYWLQGIPQGLSIRRDMYLSRKEMEDIFSSPGARIPGSREWHQAHAVLARRREERARGNSEGRQKLIAEVTPATSLDAILATVYVDKLRGLELQVCALKDCNVMFEQQSDYRKKYCSQAHAHLASVRRKREDEKKARIKATRGKEKAK
ncbi:MAG: hypothetical protein ACLGRW_05210 [Acidobacteriota bacterium]